MANLNNNITVTVVTDAPPVTRAGFGVPLWAGAVSFAERLRKYGSSSEAAADTELSTAAKAAVAAAFSQEPAPSQVAVGRVGSDEAQVVTVTVAGTPADGDDFTITINGVEGTTQAVVDDTASDIAADLRSALTTALAAENVTVAGIGAEVTITADTAGEGFDYEAETNAAAATLTAVETNANVSVATELDAILAEDNSFYGLAIESRNQTQIERAAAWAEANKRLFIGQSSDAGVKSASSDIDVASSLKSKSYRHASVLYHSTDSEKADFAWLSKTLAADPDNQTTIWAYKILAGITKGSLTSTERDAVLAKNANLYGDFYGNGATFGGRAADGTPLDVVVTLDWTQSRISEDLAQLQSNLANRNTKIPFTDIGITQVEDTVRAVLLRGEAVGHFTADSTSVTSPKASEVSTADKNDRKLTMSFLAEAAGAIEKFTVNGAVVTSL